MPFGRLRGKVYSGKRRITRRKIMLRIQLWL
ncbi:MAG: hypothetical protein ACI8WT_003600 [Clostridium sp.]